MSRTIVRETVQTAIDEAVATVPDYLVTPVYRDVIAAAVAGLAAKFDAALDNVVSDLTDEAESAGLALSFVRAAFTRAGLDHDPEPEPEVEPQDEEPVADVVSRAEFEALQEKVNNALAAAARQGYRL